VSTEYQRFEQSQPRSSFTRNTSAVKIITVTKTIPSEGIASGILFRRFMRSCHDSIVEQNTRRLGPAILDAACSHVRGSLHLQSRVFSWRQRET
jgi:hypothetical protein